MPPKRYNVQHSRIETHETNRPDCCNIKTVYKFIICLIKYKGEKIQDAEVDTKYNN